MELGKLGVFWFLDGLEAPQIVELALWSESLGYDALWFPEARGHESFATASFILANTQRLKAATGIANIYARDPVTARQGQYTLAKFSGGRFILGLGVSHVPIVEGVRGHSYGKPVPTMRAYLDAMEKAAEVSPKLDEAPPTVLAALGPLMTKLAGERTAGAHPYNVTPEHTAWAREILGPDKWLCVEQKVLLNTNEEEARRVARQFMKPYMALPNYRNAWLRMGFTEGALEGEGSDSFIDSVVAWGNADVIRTRIEKHLEAGADHVCIQPLPPDGGRIPDLEVLKTIIE